MAVGFHSFIFRHQATNAGTGTFATFGSQDVPTNETLSVTRRRRVGDHRCFARQSERRNCDTVCLQSSLENVQEPN